MQLPAPDQAQAKPGAFAAEAELDETGAFLEARVATARLHSPLEHPLTDLGSRLHLDEAQGDRHTFAAVLMHFSSLD